MTQPTDGATIVKQHWTRPVLQVLAGGFLLPLVFEFLMSRLNNETFDVARALVAFAVITAAMAFLAIGALAAPQRITLERVRAGFLIATGLGLATEGFLVALVPDLFTMEQVTSILALAALLFGVGVLSVGSYYL